MKDALAVFFLLSHTKNRTWLWTTKTIKVGFSFSFFKQRDIDIFSNRILLQAKLYAKTFSKKYQKHSPSFDVRKKAPFLLLGHFFLRHSFYTPSFYKLLHTIWVTENQTSFGCHGSCYTRLNQKFACVLCTSFSARSTGYLTIDLVRIKLFKAGLALNWNPEFKFSLEISFLNCFA